jgi:hypothetical protein
MFDKEFYPTPQSVIDMMGIDCYDRIVYEPHGGKGDIIKFCISQGASQVIASEKNDDLRKICSEYCHIIGSDFFDVDSTKISHVNLIVMNPPFSNAEDHILHAWEIAPEGCEIIALCNWETVYGNGHYGAKRRELNSTIQNHGNKECLGDCFSDSERKTNEESFYFSENEISELYYNFLTDDDIILFDFIFRNDDESLKAMLGDTQHSIEILNKYYYC